MKWLLPVFGLCLLMAVLAALIGALLPRVHAASRVARFRASPAELYAVARVFAAAPTWRSNVRSVELLARRDGRVHYRETTAHGAVTYAVLDDRPAERLVTEIVDPDLSYAGTWTFEFETAGANGGSRLRITERGEVKNVIFRFLARFVFGHTTTMDTYLRDLGRRVGEEIAPQP